MARAKRLYSPKIKGCYECSQRRINCDRTEPRCQKCATRGIKCSGFGTRHRFNHGVASRGKWAGKTMEMVVGNEDDDAVFTDCLHGGEGGDTALYHISANGSVPDHMAPWERRLLEHFSTSIAIEMIAIDGTHNGWRHLVLPIAQEDCLVMSAVLFVSSLHISIISNRSSRDDTQRNGTADHSLSLWQGNLYTTIIHGLQERRNLTDCGKPVQRAIVLTILLLLVAVMVSGSSEFPTVLGALESALDVIGVEEGACNIDELDDFIVRQTGKLRAYAAPLLNEQAGARMLVSDTWTFKALSCLNHCARQEPQHAIAVSFITDLVHQAHDIYVHQISAGMVDEIQSNRIHHFKETLERFPPDSPGEQVLIWACFIAASASVLHEHRTFFRNRFLCHYRRNGFLNVLRGLDMLQKIWERDNGETWTSLLPQARVFIM